MAITIKINGLDRFIKNLDKSPKSMNQKLQEAINISALYTTEEIKKVTPRKTSRLRRSILPRFLNLSAIIEPNVKYAIFVHEGTRPHIITPRNKKALYWKGAMHPVKRVMHPGTKANPFMEIGAENSRKGIEEIFNKKINEVLNDISVK